MVRKATSTTAANVGYEAQLWQMADALRNNMDAAEYKHVVLGLMFLKYITDAFEAKHAELDAQIAHGDTFHNDRHPDLKADYVLANPPFIDARKLDTMADRTHRELPDADIAKIAGTYLVWRGYSLDRHSREGGNPVSYSDVAGFCKSATFGDIREHNHVLMPGRYVGAEDDHEPFEDKMKRLSATLREQQTEAAKLDAAIAATSSRIQAERLRVLSTNAAPTPGNRTLAADTQKREFLECR